MKIVPINIEKQINRVDRQRSLMIGISCGLVAFWSIYRVAWALYLSLTYDFLFGSLVLQIALWGVVAVLTAVAAIAFLRHYSTAAPVETDKRTHHH